MKPVIEERKDPDYDFTCMSSVLYTRIMMVNLDDCLSPKQYTLPNGDIREWIAQKHDNIVHIYRREYEPKTGPGSLGIEVITAIFYVTLAHTVIIDVHLSDEETITLARKIATFLQSYPKNDIAKIIINKKF